MMADYFLSFCNSIQGKSVNKSVCLAAALTFSGCSMLKGFVKEEVYEYKVGDFDYQINMLNGRISDTSFIYGENGNLIEKTSWKSTGKSQHKKFQKTVLLANHDTTKFIEDTTQRSTESILRVIRKETPALRHIYNDFLRKRHGFKGRIFFRFWIKGNGEISKILVLENTTGYKEFALAILDKVYTWRFDPVDNRNEDEVTVPFTFSE